MNRGAPAAPALIAAFMVACGCAGPTVINTDDPVPRAESDVVSAPPTPRPSNDKLANAFDYAVRVEGVTGYYFTSPSGRWQCAIKPRLEAGCQSAAAPGAAIGISAAPEEVSGPDGEAEAPNAIRVDRNRDAEFAVVAPDAFGLDPGPARELPFDRILAAAGFRCNVQEATGISCLSEASGKGFTFSGDEYRMTYSDLP